MLIVFLIFESASVRGLLWMLSYGSNLIRDVKLDSKVICPLMSIFFFK